MELLERIAGHARLRGTAVAVRQVDCAGRVLTYGQLQQKIDAIAARLRGRFSRGAVVILLCANRPEFWAGYFGILAADLSVFPVNADIAAAEFARLVERSGAVGVICEGRLRMMAERFGEIAELPELAGDMLLARAREDRPVQPGAGLLLQSSGTTGNARIVWRSAASLDWMARSLYERIGFSPEDRVLTGMPLSHSYGGEHGVLAPAWGGASVHVCCGVQLPVIARELRESGITILPGVPFLFEIMASSSEHIPRLNHLRYAISAGAQLPPVVHEQFVARFGLPIGQIYGATELGSVTFNDPARVGFDPQSVGLPLDGVKIRIVSAVEQHCASQLPRGVEGQVAISAPTMLSHVVGGGAMEYADGFALTGDLGKLDEHGALTITGRIRLLIDVGGRKVNPLEVEQVIREHPGVAECVVVPVKVSHTVSRIKAVVIPRESGSAELAEQIRDFARQRLSAYKVPRMVEFRDTLPRTPLGKVLRHLVEAQ